MKQSLHDLHECYVTGLTNKQGKPIVRHVATLSRNLPYALTRRKKQTFEIDKRYPKGTFFVITDNGKSPEL